MVRLSKKTWDGDYIHLWETGPTSSREFVDAVNEVGVSVCVSTLGTVHISISNYGRGTAWGCGTGTVHIRCIHELVERSAAVIEWIARGGREVPLDRFEAGTGREG